MDVAALEAARGAYAAHDAAREAVIKKCREPQKLAKQVRKWVRDGTKYCVCTQVAEPALPTTHHSPHKSST